MTPVKLESFPGYRAYIAARMFSPTRQQNLYDIRIPDLNHVITYLTDRDFEVVK